MFHEMVDAFLRKDFQTFGDHYQECFKMLILFCNSFVKDMAMAENLAAESLNKMLEYEGLENINNPKGWFYTIARNTCNSYLSKEKNRREIREKLIPILPRIHPAGAEIDLQLHALRKEIRSCLDDRQWNIWNLHEQGYNNSEIAAQLSMSEKTVANVKSKCRSRLKEYLKRYRNEGW